MNLKYFSLPISLLAGVLLSASVKAQQPLKRFDEFLSGIFTCEMNSDFRDFRSGIWKRYANEFGAKSARVNLIADVKVPAVLASVIDITNAKVELDTNGEWTLVKVPVQGLFQGLPLIYLHFLIGNQNGINGVLLQFNVERSTVIEKLQLQVMSGQKFLEEKNKLDPSGFEKNVGFGTREASIYCDESN